MNEIKNIRPLSDYELSSFCGQMYLVLKSGISSREGIDAMLEGTTEKSEIDLLNAIAENLETTANLHDSLEATKAFPRYMLKMVKIGEESGTLDDVMNSLSNHYEREDSIKRSIRNAITYPAILAAMMIIVIIVLLVEVMPIFSQVYTQLGTEMTGFSKVLLDIGNGIGNYGYIIIIVVAVAAAVAIWGTRSTAGKNFFRKIKKKFNIGKKNDHDISACRFASAMALMLHAGLDYGQCLDLAKGLSDSEEFNSKIDKCKELLDGGTGFSEALFKAGIFSGLYARMASVGSKTGSFDQVMNEISDQYMNAVDTRMSNRLAAIEPTLVIVLSVLVGAILLSVMLPLMGILSSL